MEGDRWRCRCENGGWRGFYQGRFLDKKETFVVVALRDQRLVSEVE